MDKKTAFYAMYSILFLAFTTCRCVWFDTHKDAVDTSPGNLYGVVCGNANRQPIADASVTVMSQPEIAYTDSNGLFRITGIVPGERLLVFSKGGYIPHTATVLIQTGTVSGIDTVYLKMNQTVVISRVTDFHSGQPLDSISFFFKSDTGALKPLTIDTVNTVYYHLTLNDSIPPHITILAYRKNYKSNGFPVSLIPGDTIQVAIPLYCLYHAAYHVVDRIKRTPIEGASVTCGDTTMCTNGNGMALFSLPAFDTGATVRIEHTAYQPVTFRDTISVSKPNNDTVLLSPLEGGLRCTLRLQGQPTSQGISVTVVPPDTTVYTDSAGTAFFSAIPAGNTVITVRKDNFLAMTDTVTIHGLQTMVLKAELVIEAGVITNRVDWYEHFSPYHIQNDLEITGGGALFVHPGTRIIMHNGAGCFTTGNGTIRVTGEKSRYITISGDTVSGGTGRMLLDGDNADETARYAIFKDIQMHLMGRITVRNCIFLHTNRFQSDTCLFLYPGEQGMRFDQCDFARVETAACGIAVHDTVLGNGDEADTLLFMNTIFSRYGGPAGNDRFMTYITNGDADSKLFHCSVYSEKGGAFPLFDTMRVISTEVWQLDPGYVDPRNGDLSLKNTSQVIDKSTTGSFLGALGVPDACNPRGSP